MQTDKPLISILMAVYEPRMDWLKEQLLSLEAQTYPNLKLYIRDDGSRTVPFSEIETCVRECIRSFPYKIDSNRENLGSNRTFEQLTQEAEGLYFAYCDQDDVWCPEKLTWLESMLEQPGYTMVYSDVAVINGCGEIISASLRKYRPRLKYMEGSGLAERYFFRNCTAGCSMLVLAESARRALPFPRETFCDQWICIQAADEGRVGFMDCPLVRYRQHGENQTGVLHGVTDTASYYARRVLPLKERLEFYSRYRRPSREMISFVEARLNRNFFGILRGQAFSQTEAWFEIAACFLPDWVINMCLRKLL